MQIGKRGKKDEEKPVNLTSDQKKLFDINFQAEIPYGKYKGLTLQEVKDRDASYFAWMLKNDIIWEWMLVTIKGDALKTTKKYNKLRVSPTETWIELYEVQEKTNSWENIEEWVCNRDK